VVDKLLNTLDTSFDTIVAEIKEIPDFEELHYVEVMTLLSIHEEKMELEMVFKNLLRMMNEKSFHIMAVQQKKKMSRINTPSQEKWKCLSKD
jgi:hypothetical protein